MRRFLTTIAITGAILLLLALPDCSGGSTPDIETRQSPA